MNPTILRVCRAYANNPTAAADLIREWFANATTQQIAEFIEAINEEYDDEE